MTTKHYIEDKMQVSESVIDDNVTLLAVSVSNTEPGNASAIYYVYKPDEPYLHGEDYPALVKIWNNQEDDIYDTL